MHLSLVDCTLVYDEIVKRFRIIMVRKKIDNRIRVAIENNVATGHRTFFVIVGEKAKDQVIFVQRWSFIGKKSGVAHSRPASGLNSSKY